MRRLAVGNRQTLVVTGSASGGKQPRPQETREAQADAPSCNWGQLTADAIADGLDQGGHSSSFAGSPRKGLANVIARAT